jgi:hypothetical protein
VENLNDLTVTFVEHFNIFDVGLLTFSHSLKAKIDDNFHHIGTFSLIALSFPRLVHTTIDIGWSALT